MIGPQGQLDCRQLSRPIQSRGQRTPHNARDIRLTRIIRGHFRRQICWHSNFLAGGEYVEFIRVKNQ